MSRTSWPSSRIARPCREAAFSAAAANGRLRQSAPRTHVAGRLTPLVSPRIDLIASSRRKRWSLADARRDNGNVVEEWQRYQELGLSSAEASKRSQKRRSNTLSG